MPRLFQKNLLVPRSERERGGGRRGRERVGESEIEGGEREIEGGERGREGEGGREGDRGRERVFFNFVFFPQI